MADVKTFPVNPNQFNDLYLPVQWTDDAKNPGVMDPDERWVHPELQALNAFLKKSGQKPVDPQVFVDIGMNYLRTPVPQRVTHPLLTRDIASRRRIRFEFDLDTIPAGPYRAAISELVKAAAFAQVYFDHQRDPEFAKHLKMIIDSRDYTRLRHFLQNRGSKCISVKENGCSSLPGVNIDPNGVWWPDEFTQEDIDFLNPKEGKDGYNWSNAALKRKVFAPGCRVVRCSKEDSNSFEYKGVWYRPAPITSDPSIATIAKMMASHLAKASNLLKGTSPDLSRLLAMRADHIERGGIFGNLELDKQWVHTQDPILTTAFGREEKYAFLGSAYGIKSTMQAVLGYVRPELQDYIAGATKLMDEANGQVWQIWESRGEKYPIGKTPSLPPRSVVIDLIMNTGAMNAAGYVAGGFLQPSYDKYDTDIPKDEQQTKFVLYGPICAARIQNQGIPVARAAFDEVTVKELENVVKNVLDVITFAESHELGHSLGGTDYDLLEVVRLGKKLKPEDVYGNKISRGLEEMKADIIGLSNLELYEEKRIISRDRKFGAYKGQFGNMLRNLNLGADDSHGHGGILTFYLYMKHGVVTYNKATGKYSADFNKLDRVKDEIIKEGMDIYYSFDPKKVAEFDRTAQDFLAKSPMGKYIAEVKGANLPGDNLPYYLVKGELGEF